MPSNLSPPTERRNPESYIEFSAMMAAPFRSLTEGDFERLKFQLLHRRLEAFPSPEAHAPVRRAANEAAALAWEIGFPLLVFPVLFEEKAERAEHQARRQGEISARSRKWVAELGTPA
jgi:hypothetical protein